MAVTDKNLTNIHIFPTTALYTSNLASIADTDISLVGIENYNMGNIIDKSLGENGYIRYDNGLLIQWGKSISPVGCDASVRIAFPTSFSSTVFTIVATKFKDAAISSSNGFDAIDSWTTDTFVYNHGNDAYFVYILWMAIGI